MARRIDEAELLVRVFPATLRAMETPSSFGGTCGRATIRCRFPNCNRSPSRCDIDHTVDAARGGPTSADNLAHLCRRHHTLKHHARWRVRQLRPGVLQWTSPLGQVIIDRPETAVHFR